MKAEIDRLKAELQAKDNLIQAQDDVIQTQDTELQNKDDELKTERERADRAEAKIVELVVARFVKSQRFLKRTKSLTCGQYHHLNNYFLF